MEDETNEFTKEGEQPGSLAIARRSGRSRFIIPLLYRRDKEAKNRVTKGELYADDSVRSNLALPGTLVLVLCAG